MTKAEQQALTEILLQMVATLERIELVVNALRREQVGPSSSLPPEAP